MNLWVMRLKRMSKCADETNFHNLCLRDLLIPSYTGWDGYLIVVEDPVLPTNEKDSLAFHANGTWSVFYLYSKS